MLATLALVGEVRGLTGLPRRLYMDWVALNCQSTTRQIVRPLTEEGRQECLTIKQSIREAASQGTFLVDAFAAEAARSSTDKLGRANGGLVVAERIRQGVCRNPYLDRACFTAPLGQVSGPIRSDEGYHLVLVQERIGLEMHDAGMSRVVAEPRTSGDGVRSVLAPPDPNELSEALDPANVLTLVGSTAAIVLGGELIAQLASSVDVEAIANSVG